MNSSQDHVHRITKKLVTYAVLYQTCSDRVRELGVSDLKPIYDKALEEWHNDSSNPLFEPPVNDAEKKAAFFAKCDEICQSKPKTALDYCKISFACWAGIQVIGNQELANMPNESHIMGNVHRLTAAEYIRQNPKVAVVPDSPDTMNPKLPSHLVDVVFPNWTTREVEKESKLGPHLIDQTIRFRDQETGEILECTIQDCGTSHIRGEWYEVTYGDTAEPQMITRVEMEEIITNRVQDERQGNAQAEH